MIVADSSALIEYYRPAGHEAAAEAVAEAIAADRLAVNGVIQVEVVGFAPSGSARRKLVQDFRAFHWLELTRREFDLAHELGFRMRRSGLTLPATDLIIAASAIVAGAVLLHLDNHFDLIARHSDLRVVGFPPPSGAGELS